MGGDGGAGDTGAGDAGDEGGGDLGALAVPVDDGGGLLGLADLEAFPEADLAFGGADGDHVGGEDEEGVVGEFDGGGVGRCHLGAAVDDHNVVAASQDGDDLAGGAVGDVLAAFALGGGRDDGEAALMGEDHVGEDARRDVADGGEVGDRAAELHVEVGGDVAGLEVEVEQGRGTSGRLCGEGELDGGEGGADAALGAGDGDDAAAAARREEFAAAAGGEVAAHVEGPGGGGLDAFGERLVAHRESDDAACPSVHGGGDDGGAGVGGEQHDADRRKPPGDLADEVERGRRAHPLVDEDDLGQLVQGLGGERGEGVEQRGRVGQGLGRFGVGKLGEEGGEGAGGVLVTGGGENA